VTEPLWVDGRLSWQLVAMVVAVTLLLVAADVAWRRFRLSSRTLAMILVPAAVLWLAGAWLLAARLPA
jgi:hypothetical protein